MEMTNALAYYDTATITAVKKFIVQAPNVLNESPPYLSLKFLA